MLTRREVLKGLVALPLVAALPRLLPPPATPPIGALTLATLEDGLAEVARRGAVPTEYYLHHSTRRAYLALTAANRRFIATHGP